MDHKTKTRFSYRLIKRIGSCWEWQGNRDKNGYGRFKIKRSSGYKNDPAHRVMWEIVFGPIPENMLICHTCDNPPCVNPRHLFLGTPKTNMTDKIKKGRLVSSKGSKNGMARLTEKMVLKIRLLHTFNTSIDKLAKKYRVSGATISRVINRKTWRHL